MSNNGASPRWWERGGAVVAALLVLLVCLSAGRDIWPPDEPRYIQVAREMAESGSWLVPRINGRVYDQKPPLFFWALALSGWLLGAWNRYTLLLPSVGAAIGAVFVTRWFGRLSGRPRTGVLAGWILAGSLPFLYLAQLVRMDMLLLLCVTAALACIFRLCMTDAPAPRVTAAALYASLAAGTLVKGPVAVALPALATIAWLATGRDRNRLRRLRLGWGLPLCLALVLAWAVPAALAAGPDYVWHVLVEQSTGRMSGDLPGSHPKPWYFYLVTFPWLALPWFPFFVAAAARVPAAGSDIERQAVRLWWSWWMTTFLFFSAAAGKLEAYLLPLFPAFALITARFFDRVDRVRPPAGSPPEVAGC